MSLTPIADGHLGAVVTYLEMTERPILPEHSSPSSLGEGDQPQAVEGQCGEISKCWAQLARSRPQIHPLPRPPDRTLDIALLFTLDALCGC